jgi:hypothetical protein
MTLARKLAGLAQELKQDGPVAERLFRVARRSTHSLGLSPALSVERGVIVETRQPPQRTRGLADLLVRRAQERDIVAIAAIDNRDAALFRTRLANGDLVYLGQLDDDIVCATCFHRGPTPFDEERGIYARWALEDASTFWSYDAMARLEIRSLGVVAKLFETALREVFEVHGARRVMGCIHDWNHLSLTLHERLGFTTIGRVTTVGLPGLKWLRWESGGRTRRWLLPRNGDFALPPATI